MGFNEDPVQREPATAASQTSPSEAYQAGRLKRKGVVQKASGKSVQRARV